MTQQEQNRALILEVYRNIDAQNFERCMELVSPDCKTHTGGNVLDRAAWAQMGEMFMRSFPDGRHVFELVDAVGDELIEHRSDFHGAALIRQLSA